MSIMEKVTEKILALVQATKDNKDFNAKKLSIAALKIALAELDNYPDTEFIPGPPNSKTGIKSVDLLPFATCHSRCSDTCGAIKAGCKYNVKKCYAYKLMYRNPSTCARYAINTALLIKSPDKFFEGVNTLLRCERFVRLFVAGDANIPGFFPRFCEVVKANPHCLVQGFSKCYEVINDYIAKNGALPVNLKLLLSGWNELKPVNPYNLPISDVYDGTLPDGWLSCGGDCHNCACVGLGCWKAAAGDVVGLKKH